MGAAMARALFIGTALMAGLASSAAWAFGTADGLRQTLEQTLSGDVKAFYAARQFQPLWSEDDGSASGSHMQAVIADVAQDHGLPPASYAVDPAVTAEARELALTGAVIHLARDLATGRVAPYRVIGGMGPETRPQFRAVPFLKGLISGDAAFSASHFDQMAPDTASYQALKGALKEYRAIADAGGWPLVGVGPTVKPGESDPRIPALRRHLRAEGDSPKSADNQTGDDSPVLDPATSQGLKRFQARLGIDIDGALGKRTVAELDVTAADRVRQIEVTLERLRQEPRAFGATHIEVNVASQLMTLYEDNQPSLDMRVVVGDIKHQTPNMVTSVAAITVNPAWTVPPSIARKEILPKLKRDPQYLAKQNLHIVDAASTGASDTTGSGIDWSKFGKSFPFRLRQQPGPDNALGKLKFNLTDQDAIYMHDTPQRTFFKRSYRALSHGCIRLEQPDALANHLLTAEWRDKLPGLIADGNTRTVMLRRSLPVYLRYLTAWVQSDGSVAFRADIYGADQRLEQLLNHPSTITG